MSLPIKVPIAAVEATGINASSRKQITIVVKRLRDACHAKRQDQNTALRKSDNNALLMVTGCLTGLFLFLRLLYDICVSIQVRVSDRTLLNPIFYSVQQGKKIQHSGIAVTERHYEERGSQFSSAGEYPTQENYN